MARTRITPGRTTRPVSVPSISAQSREWYQLNQRVHGTYSTSCFDASNGSVECSGLQTSSQASSVMILELTSEVDETLYKGIDSATASSMIFNLYSADSSSGLGLSGSFFTSGGLLVLPKENSPYSETDMQSSYFTVNHEFTSHTGNPSGLGATSHTVCSDSPCTFAALIIPNLSANGAGDDAEMVNVFFHHIISHVQAYDCPSFKIRLVDI